MLLRELIPVFDLVLDLSVCFVFVHLNSTVPEFKLSNVINIFMIYLSSKYALSDFVVISVVKHVKKSPKSNHDLIT